MYEGLPHKNKITSQPLIMSLVCRANYNMWPSDVLSAVVVNLKIYIALLYCGVFIFIEQLCITVIDFTVVFLLFHTARNIDCNNFFQLMWILGYCFH